MYAQHALQEILIKKEFKKSCYGKYKDKVDMGPSLKDFTTSQTFLIFLSLKG